MSSKHDFIFKTFFIVFIFAIIFYFAFQGSFMVTAYIIGDFFKNTFGFVISLIILNVLIIATFLIIHNKLKKV